MVNKEPLLLRERGMRGTVVLKERVSAAASDHRGESIFDCLLWVRLGRSEHVRCTSALPRSADEC